MADAENDPHRFEFDLDRGIRVQAVEKLETSPQVPLAKNTGPKTSGIYALYHKGRLVYIGKASKDTTKSKPFTMRSIANEAITTTAMASIPSNMTPPGTA